MEAPWTTSLDPMDLLEATNQEIQSSGIKIPKKIEQPDNPYKRTGQFYRNQNRNENQNDNRNNKTIATTAKHQINPINQKDRTE